MELVRKSATKPLEGKELEVYLKNHEGLISYDGKMIILKDYWRNKTAIRAMDLTNKFTFIERMNCSFEGRPTPMEIFQKNRSMLLKEYSGDEKSALNSILKNHKHCTQYPIPHCMGILNLFKPKRWLDPTAGWGDRLLSALAYGCDYVGVDTNTALFPKYHRMIETYADAGEYKVINESFLTAKLGTKKFDLVFTSPPFSMYEIYEGMTEWKSEKEFMTEFLFPLIEKSSRVLRKGGHLVLYIMDPQEGRKYIHEMLDFVEEELSDKLRFKGVIYYQGTRPRPHYVWKKL